MTYGRSQYYQNLYNEGIMYLNSGNYTQALRAFEAARRAWDNSYAYSGIGRAYYGMGEYGEALRNFEIAYRMYSPNLQAAHWRAKALGKLKRYSEAEEQFKVVLSILSNGPVSFHQEVLADYEDMKDERESGVSVGSNGRNVSWMYGIKSKPAPRIIVNDVSGPVNIGGIQATDDAVVNRSSVTEIETNFCPWCGSPVDKNDIFCRKCGKKL